MSFSPFLQTLGPWFPNEIQNLLSSEKRTLDHWATGQVPLENRPRHGRPKKLSARDQHHIQRLCLGNRCMSAASIAAEVEGGGGQPVSAQIIPTHGIISVCMAVVQKEASSKDAQTAQNSLLKTSRLGHGLLEAMSYGLMSPIYIYFVQMVSSVCGGTRWWGVQRRCVCLQSSMVVEVSWSEAAWVLPAVGSYSSLREPWMPTCTVTYWSRSWSPPFRRLGRRAVLQHDNDPKHTFKTTTAC